MRIKDINIKNFKRFTDLTICNIPKTAKLVIMVGPNGCGKSSVFDAFKVWHLYNDFQFGFTSKDDYFKKDNTNKDIESFRSGKINFYEETSQLDRNAKRGIFYFRTAYRNSPAITTNYLQTLESPLDKMDQSFMIENDSTVNENYQRLIGKTLSKVYDKNRDNDKIKDVREEIIGKIRASLKRLFPDLLFTEVGVIPDKAEFYFQKGVIQKYQYENLSGGEKAAFDILLDIVIKSEYFNNTIFCIDEPETHIHTKLQADLLAELFHLIDGNSQLWIATHSFGMMKEAKKLSNEHPGEVVFLNFEGYDFDEPTVIEPSKCDSLLWNKMLETAFDDYAPLVAPKTIVFCEGDIRGRKRKDFDKTCYSKIFGDKHPDTIFYSLGSCTDIEKDRNAIVTFISNLFPGVKIIRLIDHDDRSSEEVAELLSKGIKVLTLRNIESYLLDDEVLKKVCKAQGKEANWPAIQGIKRTELKKSVARRNPSDDLKSASNGICSELKKELQIVRCGDNSEALMLYYLAKLITPDMEIYKKLEKDIFG